MIAGHEMDGYAIWIFKCQNGHASRAFRRLGMLNPCCIQPGQDFHKIAGME